MLDEIVNKQLGLIFWDCALDSKDAKAYLQKFENVDLFWRQCAIHWFNYTWHKYHEDQVDPHPLASEIIWYNSQIRINQKVVEPMGKWASLGCIYITDLLTEEGEFYCYVDAVSKYDSSVNWLQYLAICKAIPKQKILNMKSNLIGDRGELSPYAELYSVPKKSHEIYCTIRDQKSAINHVTQKMKKYFSMTKEVQSALKNIKKISNISKLRDFQYRIIQDVIHCNNRLFYWKIVTTQQCEFCNYQKKADTRSPDVHM